MAEAIKRSFSGGELAPALYSRVDQVKYTTGLRTCRNMLIKRHGGAQNRPGTQFICEVKDSTRSIRLIPFIFNTDQTYILEFGHNYIRFIRNAAQVTESAQNITNITQADPAVVTITSHGYSNGDEVFISGVGGMTQVNNRNFKVANVAANTFELQLMNGDDLDSTGYDAYTTGGTAAKIYEIASPYDEADLPGIRFAQSADVITLCHPSYAPRELSRTGHTSWTLSTITFGSSIAAPTGLTATPPLTSIGGASYYVTAVNDIGEESTESNLAVAEGGASQTPRIQLSWTSVTGAVSYNVYRNDLDRLLGSGYVGTRSGGITNFVDPGEVADGTIWFPTNDNPFNATDDYPTAVGYYQGRRVFANTNNFPETIWMTHSGSTSNLSITFPSTDSSRIVFSLNGSQVNSVRHVIDIGQLVSFTQSGEWTIRGSDSGIVTPGSINPVQQSYNGCGELRPLIINNTALYVQERGTKIRDLRREIDTVGYNGNDLTIFASHLFDDYTISDWAYQKIPDSTIFCARSDGTLLGLTYIQEHEIIAWHRHDFQGDLVENVQSIPEGNEDSTYLVIQRTVPAGNGATSKRYIEKFATRQLDKIRDAKFTDSHLTYDGNSDPEGTHSMTLSGGTTWAYDETITLTSSTSYFVSTDVGLQVHLRSSDNDIIRFTIESYSSGTVVTGKPHKTVPTTLRGIATLDWGLAVKELSGLWHIEGKDVSVTGDGFVAASVNNSSYDTVTVSDGKITLDKHFTTIHAGLPITSDIESLDIDTISGETMADKKKNITHVAMWVEETRGLWVGEEPPSDDETDPLENLREIKSRNSESAELPPSLRTEVVDIDIKSTWNKGGRVFVRQIDPVPATILALIPAGWMPIRR